MSHSPAQETNESQRGSSRVKRYHRTRLILTLTTRTLEIALLLVLLFSGLSAGMRRVVEEWTTSPWLIVAGYLLLFALLHEVIFIGLSFYRGYILEHRYGLSAERFGGWLKDYAKSAALSAALGLLLVEILYEILRQAPEWWWVLTGTIFTLIFIILARIAPKVIFPLFFRFKRLEDEPLRQRLESLAQDSGLKITDVFEMDLSRKSRAANAALAGLGRTRRIILSDTLLRNFPREEVEVVMAHEMGHYRHGHLLKAMVLQAAMIFMCLFLIDLVMAPAVGWFHFRGLADVTNFPLMMLVATGLGISLMTPINALLRQFEREADRYSIEATKDPEAFLSAMKRLARMNLADTSPHPLVEAIFYTHPSIGKRIALCRRLSGLKEEVESSEENT